MKTKNKTMEIFQKFTLKSFLGKTGDFNLIPVELKDFINFDVKRIYYINEINKENVLTGAHCHKIEEEFFLILNGSATLVIDKGNGLEDINLKTNDAIYLGAYVWHHFKDMEKGTILLALSSTNYSADRSDYIEDYNEYLQIRDEKLLNKDK
jgi:mannose-6-phosphate isomerase-like protein (cupin superfamily)